MQTKMLFFRTLFAFVLVNSLGNLSHAGSEMVFSTMNQLLLATDWVAVGPNGAITLVYRDGEEISWVDCEPHSVLKDRSDCKPRTGAVIHTTSVSDLKNQILETLRSGFTAAEQTEFSLTRSNKKVIAAFHAPKTDAAADRKKAQISLETSRSNMKEQINRIAQFAKKFGWKEANTTEFNALKREMRALQTKLSKNAGDLRKAEKIEAEEQKLLSQGQALADDILRTLFESTENKRFRFVLSHSPKDQLAFALLKHLSRLRCATLSADSKNGARCSENQDGFIWERVTGGWLLTAPNASQQTIWYTDSAADVLDVREAAAQCHTQQGQQIPTEEDFRTAGAHGLWNLMQGDYLVRDKGRSDLFETVRGSSLGVYEVDFPELFFSSSGEISAYVLVPLESRSHSLKRVCVQYVSQPANN